jgi:hypothetical protein
MAARLDPRLRGDDDVRRDADVSQYGGPRTLNVDPA